MSQTIRPVFTFDLNVKIAPGRVTVGKYDGIHPCLTVATISDKVLIHSPHRKSSSNAGRIIPSESNKEISTLNVNHTITALLAGELLPNEKQQVLVIGSPTHVLVYHVHDNKDVFYRECPDGAKTVAIGQYRERKERTVLVGGNSSVHCYDCRGDEVFWTAVGDAVTGLVLLDFDLDGQNELVVSSEDYNIRVYKKDKLLAEQAETEMVTGLAHVQENRYAYSVSNGTIGVYEQDLRLWRVKSKNFAVSMYAYDLMGQGTPQLITGWSNGKLDCRSVSTGEVLFKDTLTAGSAGIVEADYRAVGKTDLICVSTEGEVRGYCTTRILTKVVGSNPEQDTIRELLARKQALALELKHYENNTRYNEESSPRADENVGVIPANTRLQIGIATSESGKPNVEVAVSTNNDTLVRAVMVFAEGIFKGETLVVHPPDSKLSNHVSVPLCPPKDIPVDIHIKAFVGYKLSKQYHVFELTRQLPRFSMYSINTKPLEKSSSYVEFRITERIQRICMWINQNFLLDVEVEPTADPEFKIQLNCLRDSTCIGILIDLAGKVTVYTRNMLLAGDLIRSLANFLNLDNLQSLANFPDDEARLKEMMGRLSEIQDARFRLGADVAGKLGMIRTLVVQAESSKINSINETPGIYMQLNNANNELVSGYNIRLTNYNEGQDTMKNINCLIQQASRLRVGKYSADMISNCRLAIKSNNIESLVKTIRTGAL